MMNVLMSFMNEDGNSSKCSSSTELSTHISRSLKPGIEIPVGEFFWINEFDFIGYDSDSKHGHDIHRYNDNCPGSVEIDCTLSIRAIKNNYAIVRLNRPKIPFGALAPIGTVFQIPISQLLTWSEKLRAIKDHKEQRSKLTQEYCK